MVQKLWRSVWSCQFLKFSAVGLSNLLIDFAVLNLLSYATNTYAGTGVVALNVIAFGAAVTNSYVWNKRWTFRHGGPAGANEYSKFFAVNIGGAALNSGIVYVVTTLIGPLGGFHPQLWLNAAKIVALPFSTLWNFLGSKHLIFKAAPRPAGGFPPQP